MYVVAVLIDIIKNKLNLHNREVVGSAQEVDSPLGHTVRESSRSDTTQFGIVVEDNVAEPNTMEDPVGQWVDLIAAQIEIIPALFARVVSAGQQTEDCVQFFCGNVSAGEPTISALAAIDGWSVRWTRTTEDHTN